jgi:hypothetical protein
MLIQRRIAKLTKRMASPKVVDSGFVRPRRFRSTEEIEQELLLTISIIDAPSPPSSTLHVGAVAVGWACSRCTFINDLGDCCEMCASKKRPRDPLNECASSKSIRQQRGGDLRGGEQQLGTQLCPVEVLDDSDDDDDENTKEMEMHPVPGNAKIVANVVVTAGDLDHQLCTPEDDVLFTSIALINAKNYGRFADLSSRETELLETRAEPLDTSDNPGVDSEALLFDECVMLGIAPLTTRSSYAVSQISSCIVARALSSPSPSGREAVLATQEYIEYAPPVFTIRGRRYFPAGKEKAATGKSRFFGTYDFAVKPITVAQPHRCWAQEAVANV